MKIVLIEEKGIEKLFPNDKIVNITTAMSFAELKKQFHNLESDVDIFASTDDKILMLTTAIKDYYILRDGNIQPIQSFTNKELRPAHNLFKMYIAGTFN